MGCLGDQMPPDCKKFVDDFHGFIASMEKIMFGIPFHKIWRNKVWRDFLAYMDGFLTYTSSQVSQKIQEIEEHIGNHQKAELGMDFLTYMIHSGKMSVPEIAVNTMDLLSAGVDTVRQRVTDTCKSSA